jgi:hypothetical protein
MMADTTAADCLQSNLLQLAPKIIGITEKRNLTSEKAKKLLLLCQPSEIDDESEGISAGTHILFTLLYIYGFTSNPLPCDAPYYSILL